MNAILDLIRNNPNGVATFLRALFLAVGAFGVALTVEQMATTMFALESFLLLFQQKQTLPKSKVDEQVSAKVAHREMAGTTGTGAGLAPARGTGTDTEPTGGM